MEKITQNLQLYTTHNYSVLLIARVCERQAKEARGRTRTRPDKRVSRSVRALRSYQTTTDRPSMADGRSGAAAAT